MAMQSIRQKFEILSEKRGYELRGATFFLQQIDPVEGVTKSPRGKALAQAMIALGFCSVFWSEATQWINCDLENEVNPRMYFLLP